jgi:hypothetical protein
LSCESISDNECKIIVENKNTDEIDISKISLDELEQYTMILDKKRYENYNEWLNVGFMLYNVNKDSLYIWKKFSKQNVKYDEKECETKWKTF